MRYVDIMVESLTSWWSHSCRCATDDGCLQVEIDQLVEHKLQPFNVRWPPAAQHARACRPVSYVYSSQLFDVKLYNVKGGEHSISFNELESTLGGGKVGRIAPAAPRHSRA